MAYDDLANGLRFLTGLPRFLRQPVDCDQASMLMRSRLANRERDLLWVARAAIYGNSASPYRPLLAQAGCELGDLERLIQQEGAEDALRALFYRGIYFTVEELKGRRPVVRGSATFTVDPDQFRNPLTRSHLPIRSGGSRSNGTPIILDFASVRDQAIDCALNFEARGAQEWDLALWGVPGSAALVRALEWTITGRPPLRWFSQIDPSAGNQHPRYRWSARALRWGGLAAGLRLPRPEFVPIEDPQPILAWLAATLRAGRTPYLDTFASSGVRLAQAALQSGLDLRGARLAVSGEPVTATRLAAIRAAGLEAVPRSGAAEAGHLGYGCLAPAAPGDLHAVTDLNVFVQPGPGPGSGPEAQSDPTMPPALPADALLLSSLRPTARLILLNVSLGDQARLEQRSCGCAVEQIGWTTHLTELRSFEKLTVGGMMLLDVDLLRILEELLPARFGGDPTCYQLVEDAESGRPQLRLLIHPRLGPLDEQAVADTFLRAIGQLSAAARVLELQWRGAGLLKVERCPPLTTALGKISHIHRRPAPLATNPPDVRIAR